MEVSSRRPDSAKPDAPNHEADSRVDKGRLERSQRSRVRVLVEWSEGGERNGTCSRGDATEVGAKERGARHHRVAVASDRALNAINELLSPTATRETYTPKPK